MLFSALRRLVAVLILASGAAVVAGVPANAVCYTPSQQLPASTLARFVGSPSDILKLSNAELISKVRDLVASSPAALQTILGLIDSASPQQANAIGTGLGQAALICVRTDQAFATEIQNAVAGIDNSELTLAFAAVLGDKPIGALGGGAGSAGAGGGQTNPVTGSATGTFFGSSGTSASFFTRNTGFNFFTSSSSSAPGAPSNTTTFNTVTTTSTTTTVTSVSPTQ
jgi:hypothetical protein